MRRTRPLSDDVILLIFTSIGILTLIPNLFCLYLIIKLRPIYARNVFVVVTALQTLYLLESFHVSVLFLPFIYITLGGGYCIGWLCEPHRVSFPTNLLICMILMVNLCSLFIVLLFHRHQNLLKETSKMKLGKASTLVISSLLLIGVNALPIRYSTIFISDSREQARILEQRCPECDWGDSHRNFGVLTADDAVIDGYIVIVTLSLYTLFGFVCALHIKKVISQQRNSSISSGARTAVRISQTRQSLVQIVIFIVFFATPISLFMSLPLFRFHNDSLVLLPSLFLFSVNALVHSLHTISTTPPMLLHIRQMMLSHGITRRKL